MLGKAEKGSCLEKFKAVSLRALQDKAGSASELQSHVKKRTTDKKIILKRNISTDYSSLLIMHSKMRS